MTALMKADGYKLRKSRSLKVCLLVAFVLGIQMAVLYHIAWSMIGNNIETTRSMMMMFASDEKTINEMLMIIPDENMWAYISTALADTNVLYIAAIVISIFVGSEYSMGTIKNSVSRGYSRSSIYVSKLLFSLIAMFAIVIGYVLGSSIVGGILYGFSAKISAGQIWLMVAAYCVEMIAVCGLYVMIAILLKSTGHAIAFSLIIPMLVSSVLQIVALAYNNNDLVSRVWLFQTLTATQQFCLYGDAYVPFVVGAVYFILSCVIGLLVFRRQELK